METYTEKLIVGLSHEEKASLANKITALELELNTSKTHKANYNKDANEEIKSLEKQILDLSQQYQAEGIEKDVQCYFVFDKPEPGQKSIYRVDTGELVRVTDMNIFDVPGNTSMQMYPKPNPKPEDGPIKQLQPRKLKLLPIATEIGDDDHLTLKEILGDENSDVEDAEYVTEEEQNALDEFDQTEDALSDSQNDDEHLIEEETFKQDGLSWLLSGDENNQLLKGKSSPVENFNKEYTSNFNIKE